jgi:hypothetical protein
MNPPPPGAVAAVGALTGAMPNRFATKRTEVRFVGPAGMKVTWCTMGGNGPGGVITSSVTAPATYNFVQAAAYRLRLSDIPGHPHLTLYPTLEVVPTNARTDPFVAHSSVPVAFTDEDFDQIAAGNMLVKVIYLPDPYLQDQAITAPDEIVSTRLDPGVDPIAEAHRRGNILLVVRVGNINLEAPNTPAMDAPSAYGPGSGPNMPATGASPMMGAPAMQPPIMPPSGANMPIMSPAAGPQTPLSRLPDPGIIQQTQYMNSAGQSATSNPASTSKKSTPQWWMPGK